MHSLQAIMKFVTALADLTSHCLQDAESDNRLRRDQYPNKRQVVEDDDDSQSGLTLDPRPGREAPWILMGRTSLGSTSV